MSDAELHDVLNAALREQNAALVAALRKYAGHTRQCERSIFGMPCNCGLDAALAAAEGK
jgi:hypothetical protein